MHHVSLFLLHPESSEQEARSGLHFAICEMPGKIETDSDCLTEKKNISFLPFTMLLLPLCFFRLQIKMFSSREKGSVESPAYHKSMQQRQGQLLNPGQPAGLSA